KTVKKDGVTIRHPEVSELAQVRALAEDIMGQVYHHLLDGTSLVAPTLEPWLNSWIALLDDSIVGVGMTRNDLVSDLWLCPQSRGKNIGSRLLDILENEIEQRGYYQARLRVVAENNAARGFYQARGWRETDGFTHEQLGITMLNLVKALHPSDDNAHPAT
ncbi:GNAT family N-acetyltransferase, partial [Gammaproteobacteria bacterium]|nr:GNAT family N-acetyltransferase [Gammaproteobacteria bacterium]